MPELPAPNLLIRKLEGFVALDQADRALLDEIVRAPHDVPSRTDLIREGDKPEMVQLVLEGFACRYKLTKRGRRQIMAYLVPGDFCDLHVFVLRAMDHSIATLSPCKVVHIPRDRVLRPACQTPSPSRVTWCFVGKPGITIDSDSPVETIGRLTRCPAYGLLPRSSGCRRPIMSTPRPQHFWH